MHCDETWHWDGEINRWRLPPKAARWKRLPGIRAIRACRHARKINDHYVTGIGSLAGIRTGYDEWVLYAIRRGWC